MSNASFDANIPLLTEVIDAAAAVSAPAPAPGASNPPVPAPNYQQRPVQNSSDALVQRAANAWTVAEWELIERTLRERILRNVQERVDSVLEHRVRDSLADVLQVAVEGLASEIKRGLNDTLEQVIANAVTQEIARLQLNRK